MINFAFNLTILFLDIANQKAVPIENINACSFENLLESVVDFVNKHQDKDDFTEKCIVISWNNQSGHVECIPFEMFVIRMWDHITEYLLLGTANKESFEI